MAKQGLSVEKIKAVIAEGKWSLTHDGGGLYLQIAKRGHVSWVYRYRLHGRLRAMGLGAYPAVSLKQARIEHAKAQALARAGTDPIAARKAGKQIAAASITVMEAADSYITAMAADWQTKRYPSQIRERFNTYVKPVIGDMPIADIGPAEARLVLQPIWNKIRPTAKRIRKHLEAIVDMAVPSGHRKNEINPFETKRLIGALSFAKRKAVNHISLPPAQTPGFLVELRAQPRSVKVLALEFVIFNAVRVADIVGGGKHHSEPMKWSHVDLANKLWTVPDTKMGRAHVVPLSGPAMAVLAEMQRYRDPATDIVFPGANRGTVISDATLRYLIYDMGYKDRATTHGFRATFKTWAEDETTGHDSRVIEAALAHAKKGMEGPYHRGSYLEKRRRLMAEWADFLEGRAARETATVLAFR